MKTYELTNLAINNPESREWALAWFRLITKDKPTNNVYPLYSLEDEEINAYLDLTAVTHEDVTYFLPFEALAFKIESDPTYALSQSWEGFSESRRDPLEIAQSVRNTYRNSLKGLYPSGVIRGPVWGSLRLEAGF